MLFNSINYIFLFLPTVFIVYFLLNKYNLFKSSKFFLLLASLYFYGTYRWSYVYIIICSIAFNYIISILFSKEINGKYRKPLFILGILGNILILLFFKYFNFVSDIFANTPLNALSTFHVIMPLGISFFTLQQISFLADCYKGKIPQYNLLDYSLFICFFPQLIAGPIVRHSEMIPQFNNPKNKKINQDNIFIGIFILTIGLLKKTILADGFTSFIDYIVENQVFSDFYISWLLAICKMMQIYFDFSGYCDMAIGSAFFFNISLPWNFNSPFRVQSITDYWKRWNMTLMRFLHEYVYNPLGGNKKGELRTNFNIIIMLLTMGIWSGFYINNIIYGLVNGILICINRFWERFNIKMHKAVATVITFISLVVPVHFIVTKDFSSAITLIKSMFGIDASFRTIHIHGGSFVFAPLPPFSTKLNIFLLVFSLCVIFFFKNSSQLARMYVKANNIFYTYILVIIFVFATLSITRSSDFIYFIF